MPVLATVFDLNNQNDPGAPISVVLGYDQDVAIRWWGTDFPGLWTQESSTAEEMMALAVAEADHVSSLSPCVTVCQPLLVPIKTLLLLKSLLEMQVAALPDI